MGGGSETRLSMYLLRGIVVSYLSISDTVRRSHQGFGPQSMDLRTLSHL